MNSKFFSLNNLPIIFSLFVAILMIPVLIWAITQKQELRKQAAEPQTFPQVDLNGDGVVNNIDLKLYLEKFPQTPIP